MPTTTDRTWLRAALAVCALVAAAHAGELTRRAGPFAVTATIAPDPPMLGPCHVVLAVKEGGRPVTGATVTLAASMAAHGMSSAPVAAVPTGEAGSYEAVATLSMKGTWSLEVRVRAGGRDARTSFTLVTGNPVHQPDPRAVRGVWVWLGVLLLAPLLVTLLPGRVLSRERRGVVAGVVLLVAAGFLARDVVRAWRRPGQMTVVESQAMDMTAMKPPVGVVPVSVETVAPQPFAPTVRYTGSVVPFAQQDVYPRTTGVIVDMPVYPGDRVRRGQVLARLDTRELASRRDEAVQAHLAAQEAAGAGRAEMRMARAALEQAANEVEIAGHRSQQMTSDQAAMAAMVRRATQETAAAQARLKVAKAQLATAQAAQRGAQAMVDESRGMVGQATAEHSGAGSMVTQAAEELAAAQRMAEETAAMASVARAGRERAEAGVTAAKAELPQAEAEVADAQADATYWETELGRMAKLLKEGAVSQEEYDKEKTMRDQAAAKLAKAKAMVGATKGRVAADEAMARQASAEVEAARQRQLGAEAMLRAAQAKLAGAKAELSGRGAMVGQREAGVRGRVAMQEEAGGMVAMRQAEVEAMAAEVATAQAAREEAEERVRGAGAAVAAAGGERERALGMVRERQAMLAAAEGKAAEMAARAAQARAAAFTAGVQRDYAELRAEFDGVVTERVTSPATLVQPGMLLLRIARLDRVRLQANVAEADAGRLRRGAPVEIVPRRDPGRRDRSLISAVFPATDPTSRTSVVEAVLANPDRCYVPGDFVSLTLGVGGGSREALTVPQAALVPLSTDPHAVDGATGQAVWVVAAPPSKPGAPRWTCSMHPEVVNEQPGKCPKCKMDLIPQTATGDAAGVARRVPVTLGASAGDRVEITRGLRAGDQVIVRGGDGLREGDAVKVVDRSSPPAAPLSGRAGVAPGEDHPRPRLRQEGSRTATAPRRPQPKVRYTCPMHPEVVSDKPGSCPKCGMDLERQ